ncbi:SDR family oxidoreductase [Phaeobacter sp. B1627]|uniref:SDR family oxidoreductase n=1 Tax=Phaeobacter sp. B1627 TaxID=2583809 RepID=UPI00111A667A|nr:SDR family oxidoreductase [Phaeobacter sp. B1627]TNJ47605.1 SDR family oxidoreductase [Phaeobacter sp. B1627]
MRALVTGAGKRLGRAMAVALAEDGYDVAIHYASSDLDAAETARAVEAQGRRAVLVQADLLDDRQSEGLLPLAAERLGGKVTCLVNNASIFEPDDLETATRDSWDRHMQSNLRAPFLLLQALAAQDLPELRSAAGEPLAAAVAINMIDQRVRKLTPQFMSYTLAKSALWTLTQTAAQSLAPRIRVNAIGPGPTLQGPRQSAEDFAAQRDATILRRGADLSDIAAALRYLVSAPAVTGQLLCVDGGQHLAWQTPDTEGSE